MNKIYFFIVTLILSFSNAESFEFLEYNRHAYKHWLDADGDCQNTRVETMLLNADNVIFKTSSNCKIASGQFLDRFTGKKIPYGKVHIDHIVPLGHAHFAGAYTWSKTKKATFANDPQNLIIVTDKLNMSKGRKSPDRWMPPNKLYHQEYMQTWIWIKLKYDLAFSANEVRFFMGKGAFK